MEVIRDQSRCPRPAVGVAVTIGAYDGVHTGHQAVIRQVRQRAAALGIQTAVVTFDRHPASVVRPESAPRLLTDLDQKIELLAETGIDYCLVITFDEARSRESAEDFVEEVLIRCLNARLVVVGEDFHFGHGRAGNVALLRKIGAEAGYDVEGLELVDAEGRPAPAADQVSSTRIRHLLAEGELAQANALLGRLFELRGVVDRGDRRGAAELGFPTANVSVPGDLLLPADGIYAGWYERPGGDVHPAAIYIGRRPTFYVEAHASLVEPHLLDFDGDLYGEHAKVRFAFRLRGDMTFGSVEALIEQIRRDCDEARRVLGVQR